MKKDISLVNTNVKSEAKLKMIHCICMASKDTDKHMTKCLVNFVVRLSHFALPKGNGITTILVLYISISGS